MASHKTERLDARLTPVQKEKLAQAAALVGNTVSGFAVQAALASAQEILLRERQLELSERDSAMLAAALAAPAEPSEALLRTVANYRGAGAAE
ncbi:MAG: DUF1778 domain-containing protein [Armatimonadetes bacterium]|nr:DUF1778 domain-containing protein [Armatimonadota bacterium]